MKKLIIFTIIILCLVFANYVNAVIELFSYSLFSDGNLVAYWRLESNANDSKSSYNGTVYTATPTTGLFGTGYNFAGGAAERIQFTDAAGLEPSYITIMAWMKITDTSINYQSFVDKWWDGTNRSYTLYYTNSGAQSFIFDVATSGDNTDHVANWTGTITQGEWYFVVGTYDGSTVKVYVNGVIGATTASIAGTVRANTADLCLGIEPRNATPTSSFSSPATAVIDDVSLFSRALTVSEILTYYQTSPPAAETPKVFPSIIWFD